MYRLKKFFADLLPRVEQGDDLVTPYSSSVYDYFADSEISGWATEEVRFFSHKISVHDVLEWEKYEKHWQDVFLRDRELIIGQNEYGPQHKKRFWELLNNLAVVLNNDQVEKNVLEFGASEFSALYKRIFPDINFDVADRPVDADYIGFTPEVICRVSGCRNCFSIDLESPKELRKLQSAVPEGYDAIIFAEVLEHLTVNPEELFTEMLSLLRDNGTILVTTPNLFSAMNLKRFSERENPQEVYPGKSANWDAHYHCREYGLKEICRFFHAAGGFVKGFYFSDCCDDVDFLNNENIIGEPGTMIVAAGKR